MDNRIEWFKHLPISATGETAGCGTIFQLGLDGELTTLYNFSGPDGANPGGLVQGTDGNLYGMTAPAAPIARRHFHLAPARFSNSSLESA